MLHASKQKSAFVLQDIICVYVTNYYCCDISSLVDN